MIEKMNKEKFFIYLFTVALLLLGIPMHATEKSKNSEIELSSQQDRTVTGLVSDEFGDPLLGVSVIIKGTSRGVTTDLDGKYSISVNSSETLVFSYIGFISKEIQIGNQTTINVKLSEDNKVLDEVIVIGYGTTTRKSAVGAVDQVRSEILEDRPVANLTQALQGTAPNLVIQQRSQNPNDNSTNLNIRGVSTVNDNSPLIVIDGMISDAGSFNKLNPNDVDNISILKDAGTAAIYGSRASNGVILITTKTGRKNEKTKVRVSSMVGWQDPELLYTPVEGYQNAVLKNLAYTNIGKSPEYTISQIRDLQENGSSEWFFDQIIRTALQHNHNLSVSGGGQNNTYMVSMGYMNQESNYVGSSAFGIERYNMRANMTAELKRFKLTGTLAYTRNNGTKSPSGNIEADASRVPRYYYYQMKADNGKYLLNNILGEFNPLGMLEAGGVEKNRNNYITANANVEFSVIDGLKLRGVVGADIISDHRFIRRKEVPFYANADAEKPQNYGNATRETSDWNHDASFINSQILADYNKTFGKHSVSGLIGFTNESITKKSNEIKVKLTDPELGTGAGDKSEIIVGGGSSLSIENTQKESINSLLGRAGYSYDEKYYAEFSFRYDGSSKFAKSSRWGFFPSVSLGWRLTEEDFLRTYKDNIGDLKLRTSYGVLGNQSIGAYDRYTVYENHSNSYAFNNEAVTGVGFKLGLEDNLTWEKTKTFNIGVDAQFLNNSLTVIFDYFHKKTTDMLIKPLMASVFGTEMAYANVGEMKNQGWDASINYRLKTGDFTHNFGGSIGDSWNELTKYTEEIQGLEEISLLRREGVTYNSYYGYKTDGLFQSYEEIATSAVPVGVELQPGDLKFVDRNGDGVIDSKDRYILGNAFPRYVFGFNYEVSFKGFDFSMLWQGVGKRDQMVRGELMDPFHVGYGHTMYKHQLDFWTPTNTNAKYPRLAANSSSSSSNNYRTGSDLYILDGKYLRLKNIQVGYTLPRHLGQKLGVENARIYVNAQNLFTFSNNSFVDPESSEFSNKMGASNGANSGRSYPMLKYYGFGINLEF